MTNSELIKALRWCGSDDDDNEYCVDTDYGCPYFKWDKPKDDCKQELMRDAADALKAAEQRIAELKQIAAHYEQSAKDWWEEAYEYKQRIAKLEAQMPKEGEWKKITQNGDGTSDYECSACLGIIMGVPDDDEHPLCNYCPICGAKMKGERR